MSTELIKVRHYLAADGSLMEDQILTYNPKTGNWKSHRVVNVDNDNCVEYRTEDGSLHRRDGPAYQTTKYGIAIEEWWTKGVLHRTSGPAIVRNDPDGRSFKEWWIDGKPISKSEFDKLIQEVRQLTSLGRLTDPRRWVREFGSSL